MEGRSGSRRRWHVALGAAIASLALLGPAAALAGAAADEAAWVFDPGTVVEIELGGLSAEELVKLETEKDEYQRGTFELEVGGVAQGPPLGEVGIRLKGSSGSFRPLARKAAFKIKFNEYVKQKFFGLKKLTLNNMVQDPTMVHETLTYELFRTLGLPAPRTGYANVEVNGVNYGLHLNVETYDDVSLPYRFATTSHLFEADEPGLDLSPGKEGEFEVDEGDDEDLVDLEALIAAANDDDGDWSDGMAGLADLQQMTRMWAVERYVGHWDGYAGVEAASKPNNYYLHSADSGLFSMLPWGTDQTWGLGVEFGEPAGGLLFNRCLADASCEALYVDALEEVHAAVPALNLHADAARLAELLAPCQAREIAPRREYTAAEIEQGVQEAQGFIAARRDELAQYLGLPLEGPATESPPPGASLAQGPCPPLPQDEGAISSGSASGSGSGLRVRQALRLSRARALGAVVSTWLEAPGAGRVTQRVIATLDGRRRTACVKGTRIARARQLTLSCRLSAAARDRLRSRWLMVVVVLRFAPWQGSPETVRRRIAVPRLPDSERVGPG